MTSQAAWALNIRDTCVAQTSSFGSHSERLGRRCQVASNTRVAGRRKWVELCVVGGEIGSRKVQTQGTLISRTAQLDEGGFGGQRGYSKGASGTNSSKGHVCMSANFQAC